MNSDFGDNYGIDEGLMDELDGLGIEEPLSNRGKTRTPQPAPLGKENNQRITDHDFAEYDNGIENEIKALNLTQGSID